LHVSSSEVPPQRVLAAYETEPSANIFPRLPVREGEHHLVWFTSGVQPTDLPAHASRASQIIDLIPTRRSRLRLIRGGSQPTAEGSRAFRFSLWRLEDSEPASAQSAQRFQ
jgi:hypothetical protein